MKVPPFYQKFKNGENDQQKANNLNEDMIDGIENLVQCASNLYSRAHWRILCIPYEELVKETISGDSIQQGIWLPMYVRIAVRDRNLMKKNCPRLSRSG